MAIEKAKAHKAGGDNLTWGTFLREGVEGRKVKAGTATRK